MLFKKIVLLVSVFVLTFPLNANFGKTSGKVRTIPTLNKKIKVNGTSQYLGYLNAYLNITRNGRALPKLKVFLNELQLSDRNGGIYSGGTPYSYKIKAGNIIQIKLKPSSLISKGKGSGDILLGSYKVNNTIEWVFPKPNTIIPFGRTKPHTLLSRTIDFKWNYTGRVRRTKVIIKDFSKNIEIFNKVITGESVKVPRSLFKSGRKYRFDLEVMGPMGKFAMTNAVAAGSEILFYYWGHIYFNVK